MSDWRDGDPDWGGEKGKAIIGALNSVSEQKVNSLYFLTMNIGGDGGDVWPWAGKPKPKGNTSDDNRNFDVSKLQQWETVFAHAQRKGIALHMVLNEAVYLWRREVQYDLLWVESFKKPQLRALWRDVGIARNFMEENLPFWEMEPGDELVSEEAMSLLLRKTCLPWSLGLPGTVRDSLACPADGLAIEPSYAR